MESSHKSMEVDAFIGTQSIGRTMDVSPEYTRRQALMIGASTEELVELIRHENPVVGLSAFEGLVVQKYPDITEFLDYFAGNEVTVHYLKGDLSSHISTLEYAYTIVLGMSLNWEENSNSGFYKLDQTLQSKYASQIQSFRMAQ